MRIIVSADLHLREDKPRCRKDENWIETQIKSLDQLADICIKYNSNLFLVGDIFHRSSEFRMVIYIQQLANKLSAYNLSIYYLCGNHDNLYHSSLNINKSAIGLLENTNNCFYIKDYNFDKSISASNFDEEDDNDAQIVFKHTLTLPEKNPLFESETPETLVEKFPKAEWIFTGDYHHNFHYAKNGKNVVNPGCLIRQASDMKDYQCGVYFVDTEKDVAQFIPIIDKEQFVDDSYILKQEEREQRIESFVDKLKDTKNISLDFIDNVQKAITANKLSLEMINMLEELLEV